MAKLADDRAVLEKLSVKELRHRAAVHNVQLTQIAAAVEKADLINLILRAGPVKDTYDVSLGVKVHTAESIADALRNPQPKPKKVKKTKGRRRPSSGSSSGSSSASRPRRGTGGRRRSRSRSRRPRKKARRSRSPSLQVVAAAPPTAVVPAAPKLSAAAAGAEARRRRKAAAKLKALPPPGGELKALPPSVPIVDTIDDDDDDEVEEVAAVAPAPAPAAAEAASTPVQAGVDAAAALGFDVLPKAPAAIPVAPAAGLRPSVNAAAARGPAVAAYGPAAGGEINISRVCMSYLSFARCELGANCRELHITDPEEEMRVRAKFKTMECKQGDKCRRIGCLYRHPGETV